MKSYSNSINTGTEGTIESVRINWVSLLSMSYYLSKKKLLLEQNTEEIKESTSIIKLNTSSLHKAIIPWLKCTETLKHHPFSCITCLIPKIDIHKCSVDNEVSALARLSFYENLLIGHEISVRCPY